jgi:hypothetical protein
MSDSECLKWGSHSKGGGMVALYHYVVSGDGRWRKVSTPVEGPYSRHKNNLPEIGKRASEELGIRLLSGAWARTVREGWRASPPPAAAPAPAPVDGGAQ